MKRLWYARLLQDKLKPLFPLQLLTSLIPLWMFHYTIDIMSLQFIEVSPRDVVLEPHQVESENDGFVYEHLKYYLSKSTRLPAITVKSANGKLVSVARHKYLMAAKELGHDRIRAVIQNESFEHLKAAGIPGIISIVPKEELEREMKSDVVLGWHVFFFKAAPSPQTASQIETRFRCFLYDSLPHVLGNGERVSIESHFNSSGPSFEIQFPTPVTNRIWADSFHAFISSISNDLAPIATYQGRRFIAS